MGELDVDPVAVVVQSGDLVTEQVIGVGCGVLVQPASELSTQDLEIRGGAGVVIGAGGEAGVGVAMGVDEGLTGLGGVVGDDGVLEPHAAQDLPSDAAGRRRSVPRRAGARPVRPR